jgi:mannose-6-phosphate isomerase
VDRPLLLAPDNVTSPSRTPWGGERIARVIKRGLIPGAGARRIGESWELSAGPELPSRIDGDARTLAEVIAAAPDAMLGREAAPFGTALLVKLLDAGEPLSVQIHPSDDYAALAVDEAGKPEAWYVEHAAPGAGIWIGLSERATRETVSRAIASGSDLSLELAFVAVEAGDVFVVEAGTPHAIGKGVTVVEPQRIAPGKKGVTYRYWDWNRRYDAEGRLSPDGAPRALHVEHALAVTRWEAPRGAAFVDRARHRSGAPALDAPLRIDPLAGIDAPLASPSLEVARIAGTGAGVLPRHDALRSITVLEGSIRVGPIDIERGRTAAIPASCGSLPIVARAAHAILASAR